MVAQADDEDEEELKALQALQDEPSSLEVMEQ